jgi:hypothetical protein
MDIDQAEGQGEAGSVVAGALPGIDDAGVHASSRSHRHNSSEVKRNGDVLHFREIYRRAEHQRLRADQPLDHGLYALRTGRGAEEWTRDSGHAQYELSGGPAAAEVGADTGGYQVPQ